MLRNGKGVQAFPEYGPERRGAPLRAYTRYLRPADPPPRHDHRSRRGRRARALARARSRDVADGLRTDGFVLLNAEEAPPELDGVDVRCVPATRLAATLGSGFVNIVMLGAVASALGEPTLEHLSGRRSRVARSEVAADDMQPRRLAGGIRMAQPDDLGSPPVAGTVEPATRLAADRRLAHRR